MPPKKRRRSKDAAIAQGDEECEAQHCDEVKRVLEAAGADPGENATPSRREAAGRRSARAIGDIPVVDEQELRAALAQLVPKHQEEQARLLLSYRELYSNWFFQLKRGFGLLMYGFGSKRQLLEDFASTTLTDGAAVVVNGFLPSVNLKKVLRTLKQCLSGSQTNSTSLEDMVTDLSSYEGDSVVYIVIHSIDGPGLRDAATQQQLAKLASCSHFRLVSSIDTINAPLLWDKRIANTQFNWWWHHTPTYTAYDAEASYVPLLLSSVGAGKSVRTAALVLESLTTNAQSVFKVLAEHQLANPEDEGMSQHQLYTKCREKFLVSSELTLKAHLTEFRDHQLVRWKKGSDGQDCLQITLSNDALAKLHPTAHNCS